MTDPTSSELVQRYEKGERNPELLEELNLRAWVAFHDPAEVAPLVDDTPLERAYALLRTEANLRSKSNQELQQLLEEQPMLLAEIGLECALEQMVFWPPLPSLDLE